MAKDLNKQTDTKRPPAPVDLAPPRARPQSKKPPPRKLAPLPELAPVKEQKNNEKAKSEGFYREAQREMGQRRTNQMPTYNPGRPVQLKSNKKRNNSAPKRKRVKYSLNPAFKRFLSIVAVLIIGIVLVVMGVTRILTYNALEILLDGSPVGYVQYSAETTSESFHRDVITHIEASENREIITASQVTIQPVRRFINRNILPRDEIKSMIARTMPYQIVARAIYINGSFEVMVGSQACVYDIQNRVFRVWSNDNTISQDFFLEWDVVSIPVDRNYEGIRSAHDAAQFLDRPVTINTNYEVRPGDGLEAIATRFHTTSNRIAEANDMMITDMIHPGDILIVPTSLPLLTVISVDKLVTYETIPMPIEIREAPDLPDTHSEVVQYGSVGELRLTRRIERRNGIEISNTELDAIVVTEPIPRIIEEGTRPSAIERR